MGGDGGDGTGGTQAIDTHAIDTRATRTVMASNDGSQARKRVIATPLSTQRGCGRPGADRVLQLSGLPLPAGEVRGTSTTAEMRRSHPASIGHMPASFMGFGQRANAKDHGVSAGLLPSFHLHSADRAIAFS